MLQDLLVPVPDVVLPSGSGHPRTPPQVHPTCWTNTNPIKQHIYHPSIYYAYYAVVDAVEGIRSRQCRGERGTFSTRLGALVGYPFPPGASRLVSGSLCRSTYVSQQRGTR